MQLEKVPNRGAEAVIVHRDVTDPKQVRDLVHGQRNAPGGLDLYISNARPAFGVERACSAVMYVAQSGPGGH